MLTESIFTPNTVESLEGPIPPHDLPGEIDNDGFNGLVLRAGIDWRDALMLRAYARDDLLQLGVREATAGEGGQPPGKQVQQRVARPQVVAQGPPACRDQGHRQ